MEGQDAQQTSNLIDELTAGKLRLEVAQITITYGPPQSSLFGTAKRDDTQVDEGRSES